MVRSRQGHQGAQKENINKRAKVGRREEEIRGPRNEAMERTISINQLSKRHSTGEDGNGQKKRIEQSVTGTLSKEMLTQGKETR